jgi:D-alanine-D-alanine ligase
MVAFPKGETFLHMDVKWDNIPEIRRVRNKALTERIQDLSRKLYIGLGGTGYGRVDIRMTAEGELVALEMNPNCAILYLPEDQGPADVPITFDPDGHRGFFDRIFRSAILRQQMRIPIEPPKRARVPVEKNRTIRNGKNEKPSRG